MKALGQFHSVEDEQDSSSTVDILCVNILFKCWACVVPGNSAPRLSLGFARAVHTNLASVELDLR